MEWKYDIFQTNLKFWTEYIWFFQAPLTGRWKFVGNHGNKALVANITAQSDVDFTFTLMQPNKEGYVYESVGNPVVGKIIFFQLSIEMF